ncbi:hypothetical protein [Paenibacillus alkalitolerans]|uniref:hypothetical protein n=1 Tax=Paenibacillus alkalitolerans TaxID=2799335 RepID=UPI0018F361D0|nr:hypothetical protein [Paenibacillus alkalitolerans]
MARYIKSLSGYNQPITMKVLVAASQTIEEGDLLQVASGRASTAVAASTTIIGIALEAVTTGASVDDDDTVLVQLIADAVIRIDYTGTTKTSLANADLYGTAFDLSDEKTINLDDTTGGMCFVVGFDNTEDTADVVINRANLVLL